MSSTSTQTPAELWIKGRSLWARLTSSTKTRGSDPRDLPGFPSDEAKAFWIRGPENPPRRREEAWNLCVKLLEEELSQPSASASLAQSAPSLPSDLPSPPQSSLSLLCSSLTSLFRALFCLSEPSFLRRHSIKLLPRTPLLLPCLGPRSHFPLRSTGLHFRNCSHTLVRQTTGGGGGQTKRGLRWLAFSPNSCCSPWILPVSAVKSVPTVVPSLPSCFVSFLPPSWSINPLPWKVCVLSIPPSTSNNKQRAKKSIMKFSWCGHKKLIWTIQTHEIYWLSLHQIKLKRAAIQGGLCRFPSNMLQLFCSSSRVGLLSKMTISTAKVAVILPSKEAM